MKKYIVLLLIFCILCLNGCQKAEEIQGFSMDAPYSIRGINLSQEQTEHIRNYLSQADDTFSAYEKGSLLATLNHHKKLTVSSDDIPSQQLHQLVSSVLPYCNQYFDISIRPVSKLWNFTSEEAVLPNAEQLSHHLKSVDYRNIVLEDDFIYLEQNAELDLGAVAKGFACDEIATYLNGTSAIIDIGGTIKTIGEDIIAGIKSPEHDGILCTFTLPAGKAVATSGSYERCFTHEDKLYHHILNPKTGYPVDSDFVSVSVISDSALQADILSTTYFAMPHPQPDDGIDAIFVTGDKRIFVTEGIKDLKLSNTEYRIVKNLQELIG